MMIIESLRPQQRVIHMMLMLAIAIILAVFTLPEANAASGRELNTSVDVALDNLVRADRLGLGLEQVDEARERDLASFHFRPGICIGIARVQAANEIFGKTRLCGDFCECQRAERGQWTGSQNDAIACGQSGHQFPQIEV